MNYQTFFLLAALLTSAIAAILFAVCRRPYRLLVVLTVFSLGASAQSSTTFLNPSRAIDWSTAGFTIPNYTTNCSIQPTVTAGSGAASANATAIQNALASCDATHNVVNVPAGTYYVAGFHFGTQGKQVLRGAGADSTDLISTSQDSCGGNNHGVCMIAGSWTYSGASNVLPPSGTNQCSWSAGYAQGTTSITLSSCGGTPPLNKTIILDQANDASDSGGVYMCNYLESDCTYEATSGGQVGRSIGGQNRSEMQVVYVTGVTSLGGGSYTVTISPGVIPTNIRSGQSPGAWFPGFVQEDGIENMTLDGTADATGMLGMFSCYQCWAKGITFINGARNSVLLFQSSNDVIRDSYFYGAQSHYSVSYNIESTASSSFLIENNIFQQVTTSTLFNSATGAVIDYNFAAKTIFSDGTWAWPMFAGHSSGNNFNLFEGNDAIGVTADNAWGSSDEVTQFRNFETGWEKGTTNATVPFVYRAQNRILNFVGNVLGQPGYHTNYQAYATSTTTFSGAGSEYHSIYDLGGGGTGDVCSNKAGASTNCDPLTFSTAMRWGNYDVVTSGVKWDSTEASPGAVPYVNANFTASYFNSLPHTLPASLYYSSVPSWWPSGKAWPPIGPDVSSGNVGVCTGTYAGSQATNSSQCAGGTLTAAWAAHATSIPAQDCYLNVMHGPPDGTGGALSFGASKCYTSSGTTGGLVPGSPAGLTGTVH